MKQIIDNNFAESIYKSNQKHIMGDCTATFKSNNNIHISGSLTEVITGFMDHTIYGTKKYLLKKIVLKILIVLYNTVC